jgi:hypothetical protein
MAFILLTLLHIFYTLLVYTLFVLLARVDKFSSWELVVRHCPVQLLATVGRNSFSSELLSHFLS